MLCWEGGEGRLHLAHPGGDAGLRQRLAGYRRIGRSESLRDGVWTSSLLAGTARSSRSGSRTPTPTSGRLCGGVPRIHVLAMTTRKNS
ncbi:hypothetical protein [Nocardioides convexus]|uniref:hypothetical protein n=1 Tax=Nocardioides convexus TaxID=2712224 RepID=UPI0024186BAF|nr:hypothetical protein [Nocardioides convexus]